MIAHLSYVRCDCCGDPAQPGDNAREARQIAKWEGFIYRLAVDLCGDCKQPGHQRCAYAAAFGELPDPTRQEV